MNCRINNISSDPFVDEICGRFSNSSSAHASLRNPVVTITPVALLQQQKTHSGLPHGWDAKMPGRFRRFSVTSVACATNSGNARTAVNYPDTGYRRHSLTHVNRFLRCHPLARIAGSVSLPAFSSEVPAWTQNQSLLAYLKKHHFITRRDAAVKLGIMNLWARIAELETPEYGRHRFDRRPYTTRTGKHVLQYWLRQGGQRKRAA